MLVSVLTTSFASNSTVDIYIPTEDLGTLPYECHLYYFTPPHPPKKGHYYVTDLYDVEQSISLSHDGLEMVYTKYFGSLLNQNVFGSSWIYVWDVKLPHEEFVLNQIVAFETSESECRELHVSGGIEEIEKIRLTRGMLYLMLWWLAVTMFEIVKLLLDYRTKFRSIYRITQEYERQMELIDQSNRIRKARKEKEASEEDSKEIEWTSKIIDELKSAEKAFVAARKAKKEKEVIASTV